MVSGYTFLSFSVVVIKCSPDHELIRLRESKLPEALLVRILGQNAAEFYGIENLASAA